MKYGKFTSGTALRNIYILILYRVIKKEGISSAFVGISRACAHLHSNHYALPAFVFNWVSFIYRTWTLAYRRWRQRRNRGLYPMDSLYESCFRREWDSRRTQSMNSSLDGNQIDEQSMRQDSVRRLFIDFHRLLNGNGKVINSNRWQMIDVISRQFYVTIDWSSIDRYQPISIKSIGLIIII